MRVTALDTETALIQPGVLAPALTCVSLFSTEKDSELIVHDIPETLYPMIDTLFVIGQNIAYDMAVLLYDDPEFLTHKIFNAYDQDRVTDIGIRQRLIDISRGQLDGFSNNGRFVPFSYSLDSMFQRIFGLELPKDPAIRLGFGPLRGVSIEEWPPGFEEYARDDAEATFNIYNHQKDSYPADIFEDEFRQARAAFALHLVSCRGMITDPVAIDALRGDTEAKFVEAQQIATDAGFLRPNGTRDTKKAKAYLLAACKLINVLPKRTEGYYKALAEAEGGDAESLGKLSDPLFGVSLDEEACLATADPIMKSYAELSSLKTIVESHIPALLRGSTGIPIQPRFNSLVASGRTSCYGHDSKNPNPSSYGYQVQNIRRMPGLRECFIPRPGYVFIDADYSAVELHTWAQACIWTIGQSKMADALNAGMDPHLMLASNILAIPYDEALAFYKNNAPTIAGPEGTRQFSKIGNFGFPGGMGVETFIQWASISYGTEFSFEFATMLRNGWFQSWPEATPYFEFISRQMSVRDVFQQFKSNRWRGGLSFTSMANTLFQGLAADAIKAALYRVVRATFIDDPLGSMHGSHVVNFIHDEIVTESPEELAADHAMIQKAIMIDEASKWLPDVKPKVEVLLTRRFSKSAKKLYDENGRLIPWG